ncbi:MAG: hypothetical protein KJ571_08660 [Bacteroidetes bacterium]|nr:hypothetical protein [Bacteroidota bacterium]
MASVKGNVLGNYRGRLGNLAARIVKGKTVLAARPSSFSISQAPPAVQARSRFAVTVALIGYILNHADLFLIWDNFKSPGKRLRNTVFQHNYHLCDYARPTIENILTPNGFAFPVQSAVLNAGALNLSIDALNTVTTFLPEEVNLTFSCLVVFYNPVDPEDEHYSIINLTNDETGFDFNTAYTGTINLDNAQQAVAAKYQNSIVLISAASKNSNGDIIQYSSTYSEEA